MFMGNREEVVHHRETRFARRSRPRVLIGNFRRGTHGYSRRSEEGGRRPFSEGGVVHGCKVHEITHSHLRVFFQEPGHFEQELDRKSTRLNSSHRTISYAVFCPKKKRGCIAYWRSRSPACAFQAMIPRYGNIETLRPLFT